MLRNGSSDDIRYSDSLRSKECLKEMVRKNLGSS